MDNCAGSSSISNNHECPEDSNNFCYVCAVYIGKKKKNITDRIKVLYKQCFDVQITQQNVNYVPNFICGSCYNMITNFEKHKDKNKLKLKAPTTWKKPLNKSDCYFCMTSVEGFKKARRNEIVYADVTSVRKPEITLTKIMPEENSRDSFRSKLDAMQVDSNSEDEHVDFVIEEENDADQLTSDESIVVDSDECQEDSSGSEEEYVPVGKERTPRKFDQKHLNDLFRNGRLSKEASELMASELKRRNLLTKGTKVSFYRNREENFRKYFRKDSNLLYCIDVKGLINDFERNLYKPEDWRLFIDSSMRSLKAVLLHNTNKYAPIPLAHSMVLKEEYCNIEMVLNKIKYEDHNWQICGDFKILSMILGQQSGFTKYPCYLCMFDSRDRNNHFIKKEWPKRSSFQPGLENIVNDPLVDPSKILVPPLHIKLGLFKQFVKALDKEQRCFKYLGQIFRKKSDAKLKEGIFDGPEIRTLFKDEEFINTMNDKEKAAWLSFKDVSTKFLGNTKDENFREMVAGMVKNYQILGCLMNLKLHFLDSHLDEFPENNGDFSEEQGERFHQDLKDFERRFQGQEDVNMFADYCWMLQRETKHKGIKRRRNPLHRSFDDKRVRKRKPL